MTDDVRNLIRFVVDGDIRNAQTQCRIMLEKNVREKWRCGFHGRFG